jgi:hypothetical protein
MMMSIIKRMLPSMHCGTSLFESPKVKLFALLVYLVFKSFLVVENFSYNLMEGLLFHYLRGNFPHLDSVPRMGKLVLLGRSKIISHSLLQNIPLEMQIY